MINNSEKIFKVVAFQVSDSIDIRTFKNEFTAELIYYDSDELFYSYGSNKYIYIFKYGVVCFLNFDEIKTTEFIQLITNFCKSVFEEKLNDEFIIETNCEKNKFGYNKIEIIKPDEEILRLIMLNVAQSVALDYYSQQAELLLLDTKEHTQILEKKGRLDLSGILLKKFIGKTLNLKNRISENLYIFDAAPETWEDENLNKIDTGLKNTFDLQSRYKNVSEQLQIVKENLDLFKDIMQHKKASLLEWIIILLIFIEVVNLFFEKILH